MLNTARLTGEGMRYRCTVSKALLGGTQATGGGRSISRIDSLMVVVAPAMSISQLHHEPFHSIKALPASSHRLHFKVGHWACGIMLSHGLIMQAHSEP